MRSRHGCPRRPARPGGTAKGSAILEIQPFIRLSAAEIDAIAAEGELLLDFAAPAGAKPDVPFCPGIVIAGPRASTQPVRVN